MEVSAQDIIDSVDLGRSDVLLPIYESVVNSIISLNKTNRTSKQIDVFIERKQDKNKPLSLFTKNPDPILNVTIVDNGEGFNDANFTSFKKPFSKVNKKYGCKGIGRFTILALFKRMDVVSIYKENDKWKKRCFSFDAEHEIYDVNEVYLDGDHNYQTKVTLAECQNKLLFPYTAKNAEDIAKGVMDHCFIYYLSDTLPHINIVESNCEESNKSLSVENYFKLESKEKEKIIKIREEIFKLYILNSATLQFNILYKHLSNKKLPRILSCQKFHLS